jgi:DNA-binding PadR family transcriptional regulator
MTNEARSTGRDGIDRAPDHVGEFEHLVLLAILRVGEGAYGVPIRDEIEATADRGVSLGALYATLRRMEAKGWVRSETVEAPDTGRARKEIAVTPEGLEAVRHAQARMRRMTDGLEELLGEA